MNCPVCNDRMREVTKYDVQIDICPGCKGVWLDRGELEKIIEMVSGGRPVSGETAPERPYEDRERYNEHRDHDDPYDRKHHDHEHDDHHGHGHGDGRRKGWLSDLFD